jgi:glycosyltransferase involved in cell wall biosynthesis
MNNLNISFIFPVFNDERTVEIVANKAIVFLSRNCTNYEIIIVNDCSPDNSGLIANNLAKINKNIQVIHHKKNLGYGAALKSGINISRYEWLCIIDGDDEYDVMDFEKMLAVKDFYLMVIAFRYKKLYSTKRIFISKIYNMLLKYIFNTNFRDISTGIRLVNRVVLNSIELNSNSPFMGAELAIKAMLSGFPVGEVGIQTFPRSVGSGSAITFSNIIKTIRDVIKMRSEVFSDQYSLPKGRKRYEK